MTVTDETDLIGELLVAAEGGDADSQYALAARYRAADGVAQSLGESLKWYRKAAEALHPLAMNDLGSMLLDGVGCDPDREEAFKWFERAAKAGNEVAAYNLAKRYLHDKRDFAQAFHWFMHSARHGH